MKLMDQEIPQNPKTLKPQKYENFEKNYLLF